MTGTYIPERDENGRQYVHGTIVPDGWGYNDLNMSFMLNDSYDDFQCHTLAFDIDGELKSETAIPYFTKTYYKSDFTKVVNPPVASDFLNNIAWTKIDLEFPFDIIIIGGRFGVTKTLTNRAYIWCIAAPDIPKINGGSHHFLINKSLKHVNANVTFQADGRTEKLMPYSATLHTNKLSTIIKHGLNEDAHLEANFQLYTAPGSI